MKKRRPSSPPARGRRKARTGAKPTAFGVLGRVLALEYRRGAVAYRHDFARAVDIRYVDGELRIRARLTRDGFIGD